MKENNKKLLNKEIKQFKVKPVRTNSKLLLLFLSIIMFGIIINLPLTSAITIQPTKFTKWQEPIFSGNESILYNLKQLNTYEICITPKDLSLKDITISSDDLTKPIISEAILDEKLMDEKLIDSSTEVKLYETKNTTYKYPITINLYEGKNKELVLTKSVDKDICFPLNPLNLFYKIGEQSITISGETAYNSSNKNVTQENRFAHLNLTDNSIKLYAPFDVIEDSNNKTYTYSIYNNDLTLHSAIFNSTGGFYGGTYNFSNNSYLNGVTLSWLVKSYWINIYNTWQHILVNDTNATYVNGVLACPSDMAYINKLGGYCIDRFEASTPGCEIVGNNCASAQTSYCTACSPTGSFGFTNGTSVTVIAYSKQNVAPLVRVSQLQAIQMCVNAGKHLCTDQEWLGSANMNGKIYNLPTDLAVSPYSCNTGSSTNCNYSYISGVTLNYACNTSMYKNGLSNCSSAEGVYDMVGNVWDWTNETVDTVKTCGDTKVSGNCYINATSLTWQSSSTSPIYGNDYTYFLGNSSTGIAVRRGGGWNAGAGAGVFASDLSFAPSALHNYLGFRCCDVLG